MKPYPKAFDAYWRNHEHIPIHEGWLQARVKHACYLAWMAGRRYEKKREGK